MIIVEETKMDYRYCTDGANPIVIVLYIVNSNWNWLFYYIWFCSIDGNANAKPMATIKRSSVDKYREDYVSLSASFSPLWFSVAANWFV